MSKQEQLLVIDPAQELRFRGPFTEVVSSELKLTNPSDKSLCFKIKTTAPKRYCVRPNSGVLAPKQSLAVQVMLQPFEYDPNEKNKHKFMVQSIIVDNADVDLDAVWKSADQAELMDSKLKCVFDFPAHVSPEPKVSPERAPSSSSDTEKNPDAGRDVNKTLDAEIRKLRVENEKLKAQTWDRQVSTSSSSSMLPAWAFAILALIIGFLLGKFLL